MSNKIPINELVSDKNKYEAKTHYSGFGWFLFSVIGMSAKPIKVEFIDRETGEIAGSSEDPGILKKFVGR